MGRACGLHESARIVSCLARESAGQCGPCEFGLAGIAELFGALDSGIARESDDAACTAFDHRR